jgi:hypothetical protein
MFRCFHADQYGRRHQQVGITAHVWRPVLAVDDVGTAYVDEVVFSVPSSGTTAVPILEIAVFTGETVSNSCLYVDMSVHIYLNFDFAVTPYV